MKQSNLEAYIDDSNRLIVSGTKKQIKRLEALETDSFEVLDTSKCVCCDEWTAEVNLSTDAKRDIIQTLTEDAPNEVVNIVWTMESYKYEDVIEAFINVVFDPSLLN